MSSPGANPCIILVLTLLVILNIQAGNIFKSRVNDKQNYYEKKILDVWAKTYVSSFFEPTVITKNPVKFGESIHCFKWLEKSIGIYINVFF